MRAPRPLLAAFIQALKEAWSGGAGALLPGGFFAGATMLMPFALGTDPVLLAQVTPGLLWVALALSSLVTMERLFQADLEDGTLALWFAVEAPIGAIAAARTLAHWIVSGLPLVLLSPLLMLILGAEVSFLAAAAYGIGGLSFFFWGAVGASLAASVRRGGLLIALIALPLYVPSAIFGAGVTIGDLGAQTALLYLAASGLFALGAAPFAMGAALRLAVE